MTELFSIPLEEYYGITRSNKADKEDCCSTKAEVGSSYEWKAVNISGSAVQDTSQGGYGRCFGTE